MRRLKSKYNHHSRSDRRVDSRFAGQFAGFGWWFMAFCSLFSGFIVSQAAAAQETIYKVQDLYGRPFAQRLERAPFEYDPHIPLRPVMGDSGGTGYGEFSQESFRSVDIRYFLTANLVVDFSARNSRHQLHSMTAEFGVWDVEDALLSPPSLDLKFYPLPIAKYPRFQPFVGAGVAMSYFYDRGLKLNGQVSTVDYDLNMGYSLHMGMDYYFNAESSLTVDIKKLFIDPSISPHLGYSHYKPMKNPWIVGLELGLKF